MNEAAIELRPSKDAIAQCARVRKIIGNDRWRRFVFASDILSRVELYRHTERLDPEYPMEPWENTARDRDTARIYAKRLGVLVREVPALFARHSEEEALEWLWEARSDCAGLLTQFREDRERYFKIQQSS